MVLSAVLRHSPRHPEQTFRRHRTRRLDRPARLSAVARYLARALGELSAALPAVSADFLLSGGRLGLSRLEAAGGRLRDRGADSDRVLLRVPVDHPAAARV